MSIRTLAIIIIAQGLFFVVMSSNSDYKNNTVPQTCNRLIANGELQPDFPGIIAHAIHSMNQEALEYLFDVDTAEDNGIPVVNPCLTCSNPILSNAPKLGVNITFNTFSMNQLDWVLLHMDNDHYAMGSYSTLERLIHQMHMIEVWSRAGELYGNLKLSPPSPEFCSCVTDVEYNGVIKILRFIALQIREPELMLNRHTIISGKLVPASWKPNANVYNFGAVDKDAAYGDVLKQADAFPKLNSSQAWRAWKNVMVSIKGYSDLITAKYVYCALHP